MLEILKEEGFDHINPSVPVWVPSDGDTIRGYILGRQFDRNKDAFYILQLTRDWKPGEEDTEDVLPAGSLVAVFETPTITQCQRLMPNYQRVPVPAGEMTVASSAFEVVMTATSEQTPWGYPDALEVAARNVPGAGAVPAIGPPPAPFIYPTMTYRAQMEFQRAADESAATAAKEAATLVVDTSADAPANGA